MSLKEVITKDQESYQEETRLNDLLALSILDTPEEEEYDTITRLAAEYFSAGICTLTFADQSRIWVKSQYGQEEFRSNVVREVPRKDSIFEMVLAENGPVIISDLTHYSEYVVGLRFLRRLSMAAFASAPVRTTSGSIVGTLTVYYLYPQPPFSDDQQKMLLRLASLVSHQLELRMLRKRRNATTSLQRQMVAFDEEQFVLYYQPTVNLADRKIIGLEALIRWDHPGYGLLAPNRFIPIAEETGLILPIGDWVLATACKQIQSWQQQGLPVKDMKICVNLSARQFARVGLADHVNALLVQYGVGPSQLGLEMTESSLIPNQTVARNLLVTLKKLGLTTLLDDFGTGYSALNHLHDFPFDILKIDRSFVSRIHQGNQPQQIIRTIIELARVLGMSVVAEGIETVEQYQLLKDLGCRYGQGYLFARPLSVQDVTRLLLTPSRALEESLPQG